MRKTFLLFAVAAATLAACGSDDAQAPAPTNVVIVDETPAPEATKTPHELPRPEGDEAPR